MPVNFSELSPRQLRVINNFCNKGFVVQMSTLPNVRFMDRDTKEIETHTLDELIAEYDGDRREETRARAAEKRISRRRGR